MLAVVMDPGCLDTSTWTGSVGFRLGSQIYHDLSQEPTDGAKFASLVEAIRSRIDEDGAAARSVLPTLATAANAVKELAFSQEKRRSSFDLSSSDLTAALKRAEHSGKTRARTRLRTRRRLAREGSRSDKSPGCVTSDA
jgi:hypothetical protein